MYLVGFFFHLDLFVFERCGCHKFPAEIAFVFKRDAGRAGKLSLNYIFSFQHATARDRLKPASELKRDASGLFFLCHSLYPMNSKFYRRFSFFSLSSL